MFYVSWLHQHGNQSLFLTKPEVSLTHDMCLLDNKGFLMYAASFFSNHIFKRIEVVHGPIFSFIMKWYP